MALAQPEQEDHPASEEPPIGANVRRLRRSAGLSLGELRVRIGVSKAHLSRIESGDRVPSLAILLALARELGVSTSELLSQGAPSFGVLRSEPPVVRADDLPIRSLTNRHHARLQPFRVVVPPERDWHSPVTHPGEEWIFVLGGVVTVHHGDRADALAEGDSVHFDGAEPHFLSSKLGADLILVVHTDHLPIDVEKQSNA